MAELYRSHVIHRSSHLEPTHCRAICEEIGERLRCYLDRDVPPPLRLRRLLDRFEEVDARACTWHFRRLAGSDDESHWGS